MKIIVPSGLRVQLTPAELRKLSREDLEKLNVLGGAEGKDTASISSEARGGNTLKPAKIILVDWSTSVQTNAHTQKAFQASLAAALEMLNKTLIRGTGGPYAALAFSGGLHVLKRLEELPSDLSAPRALKQLRAIRPVGTREEGVLQDLGDLVRQARARGMIQGPVRVALLTDGWAFNEQRSLQAIRELGREGIHVEPMGLAEHEAKLTQAYGPAQIAYDSEGLRQLLVRFALS